VHANPEVAGSFRDPSGFLFVRDGKIYRQVNLTYQEHYDLFLGCGLYRALVEAELLIPHEEVAVPPGDPATAYKIIQPEIIGFISYPYEWCFSQLKSAALLTLKIQKLALQYGMSLKDASAYNIQFKGCRPVFIDTLSFEKYRQDQPWVAYKQFCQHFLAPLVLMNHKDLRLNQLLRSNIDGIPVDLASSILPFFSYFRFGILSHIHLHARTQRHFSAKPVAIKECTLSPKSLLLLLDNLEAVIKKLKQKPQETEWGDYYDHTNYSKEAFASKKEIVLKLLAAATPRVVWDLGANDGTFSRLASDQGIYTLSFDIDPTAVEKNYQVGVKNQETNLLPLLLDLANPSPGIGWANSERMSLANRGPADTILCLGLIHHLAISNNLPFHKIAEYFAAICRSLIIEFIPKNDSQVQRLLASREDIFTGYTQEAFQTTFAQHFSFRASYPIKESEREIFLFGN
jgi:ribosomal protein L11 methylase PrmA